MSKNIKKMFENIKLFHTFSEKILYHGTLNLRFCGYFLLTPLLNIYLYHKTYYWHK